MAVDEWLADAAATESLGARLAGQIKPGAVVYLNGDLGAGKTTLVRGFIRALGHKGPVKSPTYTLVETYPLAADHFVHHLDLYRLADPGELEWIGIRDLATDNAICLIEWPEQGAGMLPPADWSITLLPEGGGRKATLSRSENLADQ